GPAPLAGDPPQDAGGGRGGGTGAAAERGLRPGLAQPQKAADARSPPGPPARTARGPSTPALF
ncbi:MAG: hypothetical protein AVDCRST_MAG05-2222, partial [uncultured Rubrobacteraceae bacterium]